MNGLKYQIRLIKRYRRIIKMKKIIKVPVGTEYEPGAQVAKAKGKTVADTPEKILKNLL